MPQVGYVLICYGITDSVCSFAFGAIMKVLKRRWIIFGFAAVLNYSLIYALFQWSPTYQSNKVIYFCISGLWGVSDAIWQTQINGK